MNSDPDSAIILYPDPDGIVTISCPKCNFARRVETKSIKKAAEGFGIRCRCAEVFRARVEFRKHYRKAVRLSGVYRNLRTGRMGQMMIEDLSIGGVGFRAMGRHDMLMGDSLEITFNLDDKKGSKVTMELLVKRIQEQRIGTEIKPVYRENRVLGFYLLG